MTELDQNMVIYSPSSENLEKNMDRESIQAISQIAIFAFPITMFVVMNALYVRQQKPVAFFIWGTLMLVIEGCYLLNTYNGTHGIALNKVEAYLVFSVGIVTCLGWIAATLYMLFAGEDSFGKGFCRGAMRAIYPYYDEK